MPVTLERSQASDIQKANYERLLKAGEPLVNKVGFGNRWVEVGSILKKNRKEIKPVNLFVSVNDTEGRIMIHGAGLRLMPEESVIIGRFVYSEKKVKDSPAIFLNRDTVMLKEWGLGMGTALAVLGDKLLSTVAPLISAKNNYCPVWALSFDEVINHPEQTDRTGWTTVVLNELGYSHLGNFRTPELVPLLQQEAESGYLVKKLV